MFQRECEHSGCPLPDDFANVPAGIIPQQAAEIISVYSSGKGEPFFQDSWVPDLNNHLQQFLREISNQDPKQPQLVKLYISQHALSHDSNSILVCTHDRLVEVQKNYKSVRRKFHRLQQDYHKLIAVAGELTTALEASVKGDIVDLDGTLTNCTHIYPELFHGNVAHDFHVKGAPEEIIRRSIEHKKQDFPQQVQRVELDFKKIKSHLSSGNIKTKLLLLQALRWRLTHTSPEERDQTLASYMRHDLLGMAHPSAYTEVLINYLQPLLSMPHPLQQTVVRLVNTMASLRSGRDYLAGYPHLVDMLLDCLLNRGSTLDTITMDMMVATLQKLSLRHGLRLRMIDAGLVEWLVTYLQESASLNPYALEYSTALLMNLCLHGAAKQKCVPIAGIVLRVLADLLGTDTSQAIPYVNGALYSLLGNPEINMEAKRMGLEQVLHYYLQMGGGEMRRQLEYILCQLREDNQRDEDAEQNDTDDDDDDEDDADVLEEELDGEDPINVPPGELTGEGLLAQHYRLVFPAHGVVHSSTHGDLLTRPVTPRLHTPYARSVGLGQTHSSSSNGHLPAGNKEVEMMPSHSDHQHHQTPKMPHYSASHVPASPCGFPLPLHDTLPPKLQDHTDRDNASDTRDQQQRWKDSVLHSGRNSELKQLQPRELNPVSESRSENKEGHLTARKASTISAQLTQCDADHRRHSGDKEKRRETSEPRTRKHSGSAENRKTSRSPQSTMSAAREETLNTSHEDEGAAATEVQSSAKCTQDTSIPSQQPAQDPPWQWSSSAHRDSSAESVATQLGGLSPVGSIRGDQPSSTDRGPGSCTDFSPSSHNVQRDETTELGSKRVGRTTPGTRSSPQPKEEQKFLQRKPPKGVEEYVSAFSSRPKIPRTPPARNDSE